LLAGAACFGLKRARFTFRLRPDPYPSLTHPLATIFPCLHPFPAIENSSSPNRSGTRLDVCSARTTQQDAVQGTIESGLVLTMESSKLRRAAFRRPKKSRPNYRTPAIWRRRNRFHSSAFEDDDVIAINRPGMTVHAALETSPARLVNRFSAGQALSIRRSARPGNRSSLIRKLRCDCCRQERPAHGAGQAFRQRDQENVHCAVRGSRREERTNRMAIGPIPSSTRIRRGGNPGMGGHRNPREADDWKARAKSDSTTFEVHSIRATIRFRVTSLH